MISMVLVSIIVLFSLAVSNLVVASIRQAANANRAAEAYFAAEGAVEEGLLANAGKSAGYTVADVPSALCDGAAATNATTRTNCPTAKYTIQGKVPAGSGKIDDEYVIPTPGTGSAGTDCNPLTAVTSGDFFYSVDAAPHYVVGTTQPASTAQPPTAKLAYSGPYEAIEHPCNWNKIKVGETVAIPLYTTDVDNNAGEEIIKNPIDIGLQKLKIKFRTACETGEMCQPSGRYKLDGTTGDPYSKCLINDDHLCGDVIVAWQINGSNVNRDKIYTLVANTDVKSSIYGFLRDNKFNSEIDESIINDATQGYTSTIYSGTGYSWSCDKYCVLYADYAPIDFLDTIYKFRHGKDLLTGNIVPIIDFLRNDGDYATVRQDAADKINKPVLKLTVVHSLTSTLNEPIPYLEYQITSNVGTGSFEPADSAQTIRAEGQSGPFKQVLEVKMPQETGLLEYVIQQ